MTELQKKELELLRQFILVCDKLSLKYFLVCGSALGAVKYGGFIPWDDDIDVAMPRRDYDVFIERAQALLPQNIFLQNYKTDVEYPHIYAKLRDSDTAYIESSAAALDINHGVFIDVFPLDGYPAEKKEQREFESRKRRYEREINTAFLPPKPFAGRVRYRIKKLLGYGRDSYKNAERYEDLIKKYSSDLTGYLCSHGGRQGKLDCFKREIYGDGAEAYFEGVLVRVPLEYDAYLTQKYGDWRADLPQNERQGHHCFTVCDTENSYADYTEGGRGMKIAFLSNYFNHHQKELSDALYSITGGNYRFISTGKMKEERYALGYGRESVPEYVVEINENNSGVVQNFIDDADVVIFGSAPEYLLKNRKKRSKMIFRYFERPFKSGINPLGYLPRFVLWHIRNPRKKPIYLLSAGGFSAGDYSKFLLFKSKAYKWGYFPETVRYENTDRLFTAKNPTKILWAGRFIPFKHPEAVVEVARRLKSDGYDFEIEMVGNGAMLESIQNSVKDNALENIITLCGAMTPQKVRKHMETAGIFLLTSDKGEGWGAVVGEAMNSGCAVIASHEAGSVPFLIQDGENGAVYQSGNVDMLCEKVKELLDDRELERRLGLAAYHTLTDSWNAREAAKRLIKLARVLDRKRRNSFPFSDGPCSKAEFISDRWEKR